MVHVSGTAINKSSSAIVIVGDGWNCQACSRMRSSFAYFHVEDAIKVGVFTAPSYAAFPGGGCEPLPVALGLTEDIDVFFVYYAPFTSFLSDDLEAFSDMIKESGAKHICDLTGAFPDVFQAGERVMWIEAKDADAMRFSQFHGVPAPAVSRLVVSDISTVPADVAVKAIEHSREKLYGELWREISQDLNISGALDNMPAIIDALSFGEVAIDEEELPLASAKDYKEEVENDRVIDILNVFPVESMMSERDEKYRKLTLAWNIVKVWQYHLSQQGMGLSPSLPLGASKAKLMELGRSLGINFAVDALVSGVPVEFLIGDEKPEMA